MNGKTHILGGLLAASFLSVQADIFTPKELISIDEHSVVCFGVYLSCSVVGALMLDIDKKGTKASNCCKTVSFFSRLLFSHRGFTHSFLALILVGVLLFPLTFCPIGSACFLGTIVGYLSHILLDMMNPGKVPLFFPFKRRFSILNIGTGSFGEYLFRAAEFILLAVLFITRIFPMVYINI